MKIFTLLLFLFLPFTAISQQLVWEREYEFDDPTPISYMPVIIDSQNNIAGTIDVWKAGMWVYSYFFKYDINGNLLSFKEYFNGSKLNALSLYETDFGYKIFASSSYAPNVKNEGNLPVIINADKNGDTINIEYPYDIYDMNIYNDRTFNLVSYENHVINNGELFFNAFTDKKIIISCFDSTGKYIWRKGFDTISNSGYYRDHYTFADIELTDNNNLLILIGKWKQKDDTLYNSRVSFIETDINGNLLNKFEYNAADREIFPKEIVKMPDGTYILLGEYQYSSSPYFLWKIDSKGNIIQSTDIDVPYLGMNVNKMKLTPQGNIIAFERFTKDLGPTTDPNDNVLRLYMFKINPDLEILWEYEWYEHTFINTSNISDMVFYNEHEFVITGYKDRYKYYIAKFNDETSSVSSSVEGNFKVELSPNPVSDYCEIKLSNLNHGSEIIIELYDLLGSNLETITAEKAYSMQKSILYSVERYAIGSYYLIVRHNGKVESIPVVVSR